MIMATTTTTTMAKAMPMATRAGTIITTATPIRTRGRTWLTARYARNVAEGLAAADPAHADAYRQRALAYGARIEKLDVAIRQTFAAIPPSAARSSPRTTHSAILATPTA